MHPGEPGRDIACFVGLDRADEMPFQVEVSQGLHLDQGLLQVIFTKMELSRSARRPDLLRASGLADRQQGHRFWRPAAAILRGADSIPQGFETQRDGLHELAVVYTLKNQ